MKETNELLEHIYKDASMGSYTMEHLLEELKERDNKIKGIAEDILKEYQEFKSKSKEQLKKENIKLEEEGLIAKMMSTMGISKIRSRAGGKSPQPQRETPHCGKEVGCEDERSII